MAKQVKCPKCGITQELSNFCVGCGLDFRAYARRVRERRASEGTGSGEETAALTARGLRDIGKLFEDSWIIYKERFATLFLLHLLTLAFMLGPIIVLALLGMTAGIFGMELLKIGAGAGMATGLLIGSVLVFIPLVGLMAAIGDSSLGVKDSLRAGYRKLWPFLWLMGLAWLLILGGSIPFVLPGMIMAVWFLPSQFIVILENERGMKALLKSMQYVRGHWWGMLGRLLLIMLLSGVAGLVPGGSLLFAPFMYIMFYLMYTDLRAEKASAVQIGSEKSDRLWIIIPAVLGYVLLMALLVIAALSGMEKKEYIQGPAPFTTEEMTASSPSLKLPGPG